MHHPIIATAAILWALGLPIAYVCASDQLREVRNPLFPSRIKLSGQDQLLASFMAVIWPGFGLVLWLAVVVESATKRGRR